MQAKYKRPWLVASFFKNPNIPDSMLQSSDEDLQLFLSIRQPFSNVEGLIKSRFVNNKPVALESPKSSTEEVPAVIKYGLGGPNVSVVHEVVATSDVELVAEIDVRYPAVKVSAKHGGTSKEDSSSELRLIWVNGTR